MSSEQADSGVTIGPPEEQSQSRGDEMSGRRWRVSSPVELPPLERTLVIIKPGLVHRADELAEIMQDNDFTIIRREQFLLQPEIWCEFYAEHYGKSFFMNLCSYMASGPVEVMVLTKENAIEDWLSILGPTDFEKAKEEYPNSLRARFGDRYSNGLHGSDTAASAVREIRFFFEGNIQPQEEDMRTYIKRTVMPFLRKALTELVKARPADYFKWLSDYLKKNNPNRQLVNE